MAAFAARDMVKPVYPLPPAPAPPRTKVLQFTGAPRADLAALVLEIKATVYARANGKFSVTEALGALELAKLEIYQEQKL